MLKSQMLTGVEGGTQCVEHSGRYRLPGTECTSHSNKKHHIENRAILHWAVW